MVEPATVIPKALLLLMLAGATYIDQRRHRIPNLLSMGGICAGLCCGAIFWGVAGFGQSVAGLLLGFCVFLPMYIFGVVGAGDVKLMAAVGAFMGPPETATAILFTLIAGGALGMITLIDKDGFRQTLGRYAFGLKYLIKSGFWLGGRHASNPAAPRLRFPYALAISIGTVSALLAPPFFKWNTT